MIKSLQTVEVAMANLEKDIRKNRQQISASKIHLSKLNKQKKLLVSKQKNQRQLIEEQLAAHYRMGREPYIKLLLSEEDPSKVTRLTRYYDYFNRARIQRIKSYQADIEAVKKIEAGIETERSLLANKKQHLKEQHQKVSGKSRQRKELLSKLNSQIDSGNKRLDTLGADQKRLKALLNSLEKITTDLTDAGFSQSFQDARGSLSWPTKGKITRRFGSIRKPGNRRWNGVTIDAREGQNIRSIYHGRVVFSGWLRGHGLLVVIEHNQHYLSIYAHNQTLLKEEGDWVSAAELIATAGQSGGQDKSALYFEIRKDGNPLNPELWCSSSRRR